MRISAYLAVICAMVGISHAEELRLTNSGQETIVMKYLPSSERPKQMRTQEIPPSTDGSFTSITLFGDDPYDVSFYLKPERNSQGTTRVFHAKVGRPIPLRALARDVDPLDVNVAIAAKSDRGQTIFQASAAVLRKGNQRIDVFSGDTDSRFTQGVLDRRWDTVYKASDGNVYEARLNFRDLTFTTSNFTGRFTDLAVFEDEDVCHIVGRWSALNSSGDVFFTVDRGRPTVLDGEYTFDGNQQRFFWKSRE